MVGSSQHLAGRHAKLSAEVKEQARVMGIHLTDDEVIESTEFRTAVYGAHDPEIDTVIAQLEHVPSVIEYRALQDLLARLEDDPNALDDLSAAEKLKFARDHSLTAQAEADCELNDAQIAEIRDPSRRMAAYRAKDTATTEALEVDERYMSPTAKLAKFRRDNKGKAA